MQQAALYIFSYRCYTRRLNMIVRQREPSSFFHVWCFSGQQWRGESPRHVDGVYLTWQTLKVLRSESRLNRFIAWPCMLTFVGRFSIQWRNNFGDYRLFEQTRVAALYAPPHPTTYPAYIDSSPPSTYSGILLQCVLWSMVQSCEQSLFQFCAKASLSAKLCIGGKRARNNGL